MTWSAVGTVNTNTDNGTTTQSITLPAGVQGGDLIVVSLVWTNGSTAASVSIPGFTMLQNAPGNQKPNGATSTFQDNYWLGYRLAAGTVGSATTDTTFTATFNGTAWSESVTLVMRSTLGSGWTVVGSAEYHAASAFVTACPDAVYTVSVAGNLNIWGWGGQNSALSATETLSGTGPSALTNFVQNTQSGNGGVASIGWKTTTGSPGGATSTTAIDPTDFAVEFAEASGGAVAKAQRIRRAVQGNPGAIPSQQMTTELIGARYGR